ncbi:membrane associated metalloprotease [Halalkaliarchaeum desulfuricum]|uniref:Membrane associated metalloprotease n=1 Tax=Halalkaliarchaeum desulfuricum TaxID=2055893 RepID=A0A343TMM8_9EURY|nr:site-2 protease family protein [Halalkaliarchaeum desulfuricum]AUX10350.1 membrane associated metalloprotease [Halalkaliarchaeum desulfuricum]
MADEEVSGPVGEAESPSETPRPEPLRTFFQLTATRRDGDRILYYGESLVPDRALMRRIAPAFREIGYEVELTRTSEADVVIARPIGAGPEGIPWTNLVLFVTTVISTLFVGAYGWYYVPLSEITANPLVILQAWPFTAAVLGVLLVHELGHYAAARYYGVNVSLPYVIPFVFPFGTLGAVIRMKGQMPSRKVLFDIGAAGPLAGLAATVVVTAIGLSLDPITIPERILEADGSMIRFNDPPLLTLIASALGEPTAYEAANKAAHPVVIGGWVGMFFTLLNLLPVGQLDGGHIMRAMIGERQETVASLVPAILFGIAAYLYYVLEYGLNESVGLWAFWGVFALFIAFNGPADPVDESQLGWPRMLVGIITFALGLLCFMLVPVQVVSG